MNALLEAPLEVLHEALLARIRENATTDRAAIRVLWRGLAQLPTICVVWILMRCGVDTSIVVSLVGSIGLSMFGAGKLISSWHWNRHLDNLRESHHPLDQITFCVGYRQMRVEDISRLRISATEKEKLIAEVVMDCEARIHQIERQIHNPLESLATAAVH